MTVLFFEYLKSCATSFWPPCVPMRNQLIFELFPPVACKMLFFSCLLLRYFFCVFSFQRLSMSCVDLFGLTCFSLAQLFEFIGLSFAKFEELSAIIILSSFFSFALYPFSFWHYNNTNVSSFVI